MSNRKPEMFAYGSNFHGDHMCPAQSVGVVPSGVLLDVAERYDSECRNLFGGHKGIIPAEEAEEVWRMCVEFYRKRSREMGSEGMGAYFAEAADEGQEILENAF